jgi:hypothetical protein
MPEAEEMFARIQSILALPPEAGAKSTAVLELIEDAWNDGYDAGHRDARSVNEDWPEPTHNPYAPSEVPHD